LFKSKIERFVANRVLIYMILVSIIDIVISDNRWLVLIGLILGTILSMVKFSSNALAFSGILCTDKSKASQKLSPCINIILFAISQLILLLLLFLTYFLNHWIFAGFVAGILIVPFIIMLNSVTEAFGFTKNHFE